MHPLQKKCLFVSAAIHAVLLGVLILGAAFVKPPPPREIIPIKYFSGRLVDSVLNGGGGAPQAVRAPTPAPAVAPPQNPPPRAAPPQTKAPPPVPPPRPETPPKAAAKTTTPATTAPPAKNPRINTRLTTRKTAEKSAPKGPAATAKTTAAANQRQQALERAMQTLNQGLASSTLTISDTVGAGVGGGAAAVNYSQAVLGAYDDAWNPPPELEEDAAITIARIVVHRTGRIVDARIIKRSGNPLMDISVQNALEAVRELPPFPEGARDLERTFRIEFNLKVKRGMG